MAEKGEQTHQQLPSAADKLPELAQLVMENERLRRKHRKVQHRRDHYARLYYRCQADLDEKKLELYYTRIKVAELKQQLAALSLPHTLKQDQPTPTSTRSDIGLHSALRPRLHQPHHHSSHHLHPHKQQQMKYHNEPPSKLTAPTSVTAHPNHIPRHRSESNSTSPDSGASFSPGGSGVDPLLRSHPASSFPHSHEVVPQTSKSMSLPRSIRLHQEDELGDRVIQHTRGYPSNGEGPGGVEGKMEGEDWVAWVQQRSLVSQFQEDGTSAHHDFQRQEGWGSTTDKEKRDSIALESGDVSLVSDDSVATPSSPVQFKKATPPSSVASPRARHPSFEPKLPLSHGFSLSQGISLPHSPLSPSRPHPQKAQKKNAAHPHVHFSLSQEAYMSSPLYIRKPVFKESPGVPSFQKPTRYRTVSEGRGDFQSPFPRDPTTPPHLPNTDPQVDSDSETEPALAQSQPQSAFRKPLPPPVYRQLSIPARLVPPVHYQMPDSTQDAMEVTHSQSPHNLPHPPQQIPPPLPSSRLPPPSTNRFHPPPPPPPTSHPPSLPSSRTRTHPQSTDNNPRHLPPQSPVAMANPETGVVPFSVRTHSLTENQALQEEEDEGDETEDEEMEGSKGSSYEGLSPEQLSNLILKIAGPKCTITKLEIGDSELGDAEAMLQLCDGLCRNTSLRELSLPNNNIGAESLGVLLQHIQHCTNIQELKLRGNSIGKSCAPLIKALMEQTSLNSLVLTGNEIEKHGDLLHRALPSDFTMEYDTTEGSVDSGVVVADSDQFNNSSTSLKYLHV